VSDSSDWNHEGNGIPCRLYNHDGCTRGNDCRFSHAPDLKSVRDQLYVSFFFIFPLLRDIDRLTDRLVGRLPDTV
jgi:hypothetical protein